MKHKKLLSLAAAIALIQSGASASVNYTAQKGDSYYNIAQKFNTTLSSVLSSNNASSSSVLDIGQKVIVNSNTYTVQKGDTYYLIAKKCNVALNSLLSANNASSSSVLHVGDKLTIPDENKVEANVHTVVKGDTYYLISKKYGVSLSELLALNNANQNSVLYVGDKVKIPSKQASTQKPTSGNYITYETYTVQKNDTYWSISIKFGIPMSELLSANSLSESSYIYAGQKLKIPVHHIAVKDTPSEKHGELLDWFSEAQYVIPINTDFTVVDFDTGKSFKARRTIGSGHADCEPLTANDTAIMKEIWGGYFNWNKRSVVVYSGGRKIAASAAGMLHAGNESAPGGVWTDWRSDNYGAGTNYDYVKGNNANGHFDLHFYNSIGHSSGTVNKTHQANILRSAGKE